ncbi:MAG: hypothetical protein RBT49_02210 [Bacteroidales bacterium]|jgi:hypothetical protein|nr:hypothetical protein [Bacteroidales bacterium]
MEERIRELELLHARLAESVLDLKQKVESHKDYCPLPEYKKEVTEEFKKSNDKQKTVLSILVTVLIIYFSGLSYLHLNKVDSDVFDKNITELKQNEIRRDERMQVLTENIQALQIKLLEEINSLRIETTKLSKTLGK